MQINDNYNDIIQLIKKDLLFPSPPSIAVQILNTVQKDDAALEDLVKIISSDPALTAKMLKVANSSFFACSGEISSINRALSVLGTNIIKNIALSFVISAEFRDTGATGFNFDKFWRYSITTAVAAELFSKFINHKSDDIFVAAMLQDIGMLVIAMTKGNDYSKLFSESNFYFTSLQDLETEKFGYNHQQVGYALLTSWNIPNTIATPVLYHHHPEQAPENCRQSAKISYYANQLANIYHDSGSAEKTRILQQSLIDEFDTNKTQVNDLFDTIAAQTNEILETFEIEAEEIKPYSLILQEANNELAKLNLSTEQIVLELQEAKKQADDYAHELQDTNSRLKELVYRDGLTGLYNHRYFHEALNNEIIRASRYQSSVSLILFDIDYFKKVNDIHGHPAGDLVLMNIAKAVNNAVRPCDIVSRYGGEEFGVILPETSAAGVKVFASRLRRCIEGIATLVNGQIIYVTVSAGATTFSKYSVGITKSIMIDTADRALYQSKQNGRNQITILAPEIVE